MPSLSITVSWSKREKMTTVVNSTRRSQRGLYQITVLDGRKEILLYIGKSNINIYRRLKQHWNAWVNKKYGDRAYIRMGIVKVVTKDHRVGKTLLEGVEGVVIIESKPQINIAKRKSYSLKKDLHLKVTNENNITQVPKIINTCNHIQSS